MADPKKPNILYIMADQMAAPLLSLHDSHSVIKTPNIEKLAKSGVVFDSAYCNSPLCAPSRFTMVTGQLPSKIGGFDNASDLPADTPTYAHYLRADGYHTALAGKMHFVGPDQLHGYEERLTSDIYPGDYGWTVNWDLPDVRPDWYHNMSSVIEAGPCVRTNQLDFDDEVIYKATQYLYDHARYRTDQPFCLTVSMTHPHDPYAMTKDYWDLYEDVDIPLPKIPAIPHDKQDPHSQRVLKCVELFGHEMAEDRVIAARRAYFAACTYVDTQIGHLMKTLENCGFSENTIVVFTGDHGDMLGERGLWYKMVWFEMSARVPMVISAPGRFAPKRVKENVSTMDLLPTFVAMAGLNLEPDLPVDGVSLFPYLVGDDNGTKTDTVLGEYMAEGTLAPVVMIRRGRWKFIYSPLDPPMLFDVAADPLESVNLALGCSVPDQQAHSTVKSTNARSLDQTKTAPIPMHLHPAHVQYGTALLPTPAPSPSPTKHTPSLCFFPHNTLTPSDTPQPKSPAEDAQTNHHPFTALDLPLPSTKSVHDNESTTSSITDDVQSILLSFLTEVHQRWNFPALQAQVLRSQRRRRLVYSALSRGTQWSWDFSPRIDGGKMYIRNNPSGGRDGPLEDVEWKSRLPRPGGKDLEEGVAG